MSGNRAHGPSLSPCVRRRRALRLVGGGLIGFLATPFLTGCPTRVASAATVTMTPEYTFSPSSLTVRRGTKVIWKNTDPTPHSTTCDPAKAQKPADAALPSGAVPWDSGILYVGETFARTFDMPGAYVYFSGPDEERGMIGTIVVR